MSGLFIKILNMSIGAGCAALIVMLIRPALRKAPKIYSYALWAVVFFRLICPFTLELPVSAVPVSPQTIPQDIIYSVSPAIQSGVYSADRAVNGAIEKSFPPPDPAGSVNPVQIALEIGTYIWIAGAACLLIYGAVSCLFLKRRLATAIRVSGNIYETDLIKTPFVLGLIRPKIYIPTGLSAIETEYVTAHELTHVRRLDHIIKPLAFLTSAVHWFNPVVWLSFALMSGDMEMSVDESVMKRYDFDIRGRYADSLLSLSVKRNGLLSPLAFGETGVKERVKNVLSYKRPARWVSAAAIAAVAVVSICLIASRKGGASPENSSGTGRVPTSALSGTSQAAYTTEYNRVKILPVIKNGGSQEPDAFDADAPGVVAYIDSTIRDSLPAKEALGSGGNTAEYTIELSNDAGGYSCGLFYNSLYNKACLIKDGGPFDIGTDFARYIASLFEYENVSFNVDKADSDLFKKYGWTLDYEISEMKNRLNSIDTLSAFNPNAYYFAYNNELSKDIGLDMSKYAVGPDLDVKIYRVHESMPKEFYPALDCRGIVIKADGKIIGAYLSAGRHSAFNACSLKGNGFEKAAGMTLEDWLAEKVKPDSAEERLSKLDPEQIIREYFTALGGRDARTAECCLSREVLLQSLCSNMPGAELFNEGISLPLTCADIGAKSNFDNLRSAALSKTEALESSGEGTKTFRVHVDLQYNSDNSISSGEQVWDCAMVYESPQTGWKIAGFGH